MSMHPIPLNQLYESPLMAYRITLPGNREVEASYDVGLVVIRFRNGKDETALVLSAEAAIALREVIGWLFPKGRL